jgi:LacI family transcriptional regulator
MASKHARRHVTIRQVAERAGVSAQTVCRVVHDRREGAGEPRARVRRAIDEMGYAPNVIARNLSRGHSHSLGVVTAGLDLMGPSRTLNAITSQAEEEGYTLLLKELPSFDSDRVRPLLDDLLANRVDGIIWAVPEVGSNRAWLADNHFPAAIPTLFLTMEPRPGLASISVDNRAGGRLAAEHLLQQGYRHVGHISGPLDWWEARQRKDGWRAALAAAGIAEETRFSAEGDWSSASGAEAFLRLRAQYPEMDAIFVANDQMALGALLVASRQRLRVPEDLGMVGFDNLPESPYYRPPLSSVDHDLPRLGHLAVRELVRVIEVRQREEPPPEPVSLLLPARLLVRASSVRPHAQAPA